MKRKDDPMLIRLDSWEECLYLRETEYTLTLSDICNTLKCSRPWVSQYIKPHLHYLYISNGASGKADYLRIANEYLGTDYTATTYYSEKEFSELIKSHITNSTRQTIKIPIELLIKPDKMNEFKENYVSLYQINENFRNNHKNIFQFLQDVTERRIYILKHTTKEGETAFCNAPKSSCRRVEPVEVKLPSFSLEDLKAVHDLRGYGGIDELVYRGLFEEGAYRLELQIPNKDGVISKKVYYLSDTTYDKMGTLDYITIRYADFLKLKRVNKGQ